MARGRARRQRAALGETWSRDGKAAAGERVCLVVEVGNRVVVVVVRRTEYWQQLEGLVGCVW
jgi:hypothetical protein